MKHYILLLSIVFALALTIFSGVLQGTMRNRWGASQVTLRAAALLPEIPEQFGDWQMRSSDKLGETAEKMLECESYFVRTYQNKATGDLVSATLLLGPPGPIAVHTPEICFPSRNFTVLGKRQAAVIRNEEGGEDHFWTLAYKANNLQGDMLRVYYAWTAGTRWSAEGDPRFKYAGQPYLYKIQLSAPLPAGADLEADDPCRRFLDDFLPVARNYIVEPAEED